MASRGANDGGCGRASPKAALYRRIARIPTSGGGPADRVLLHLTDRLDEEAAAAERLAGSNSPESKRPLC